MVNGDRGTTHWTHWSHWTHWTRWKTTAAVGRMLGGGLLGSDGVGGASVAGGGG